MNTIVRFSDLRRVCLATALGYCIAMPSAFGQEALDVNDVSYLWPAPTTPEEVAALISADDLTADGIAPIWPRKNFDTVMATAQSVSVVDAEGVANTIAFKDATLFADPHNWKVVAVRIDPCAPGCDPKVVALVGSIPQIRLIMQPVTLSASKRPVVHDVTAHLAFGFTMPAAPLAAPTATPAVTASLPLAIPDKVKFAEIVSDLISLRAALNAAGVVTSGKLQVHPGLAAKDPAFANSFKTFLKRHVAPERLMLVAFMGLAPAPEPWIFFSLRKDATGSFVRRPNPSMGGQSAQMLTFRTDPNVIPAPTTTNVDDKRGVSTALLFENGIEGRLAVPVFADLPRPLNQDIPDIIASPQIASVLNTDCVSCHSESARRNDLTIPAGDGKFRYPLPAGISGVDDSVLPRNIWNVRNFGWFPQGTKVSPTATIRTANESAESADFVNREYLGLGHKKE
jgi:hypothetical protein